MLYPDAHTGDLRPILRHFVAFLSKERIVAITAETLWDGTDVPTRSLIPRHTTYGVERRWRDGGEPLRRWRIVYHTRQAYPLRVGRIA